MSGAMHFETWDAFDESYGDTWPVGTTYCWPDGSIRRWGGEDWHPTDSPALLRPDDPPWYREPTADKPGIVDVEDLPMDGWMWRAIGDGPHSWIGWEPEFDGPRYVEARRIEPDPEPVTVPVEVGLLQRLCDDHKVLAHFQQERSTSTQERSDLRALIAEARR